MCFPLLRVSEIRRAGSEDEESLVSRAGDNRSAKSGIDE